MSKILENTFRNDLYKSLVEAGYAKEEAQAIVGKKYFAALQATTCDKVKELNDTVQNGDFQKDWDALIADLVVSLKELSKLDAFLNPQKAKATKEEKPAGDKK